MEFFSCRKSASSSNHVLISHFSPLSARLTIGCIRPRYSFSVWLEIKEIRDSSLFERKGLVPSRNCHSAGYWCEISMLEPSLDDQSNSLIYIYIRRTIVKRSRQRSDEVRKDLILQQQQSDLWDSQKDHSTNLKQKTQACNKSWLRCLYQAKEEEAM